MGKGKKGGNNINVQVGQLNNSILNAADTVNYGGLHVDLGDAESDAETAAAAQPNEKSFALFSTLSSKFTLEELETVCWELGIAYEDLPAKTLSGKARQLVQKADDLSMTATLQAIVQRERPSTNDDNS